MDHPQDLVNRAYQIAWRSGSKGQLSKIELSEALMREGIPNDLADQAACDTLLEVLKKRKREGRQQMFYGLFLLALGVAFMFASLFILKLAIVIPVGMIFIGGVWAAIGLFRSQTDAL